MTTRIKVTLDTDQWGAVSDALSHIGPEVDPNGELGTKRVGELALAIYRAARGTGEGEPCQCEEVDGE